MAEKSKGGLMPRLRFPEFRDAGEWEEKRLGELGDIVGGGTPDKSKDYYWQGEIPWVSSSDIEADNIRDLKISKYINEVSIAESATKMIPAGSVLFISRVGVGKLAVSEISVCTSQDFSNFIPKYIDSYFLAYYSLANKTTLELLGQGTSIKGFSKGDLENIEVSYPSRKEQQKIAACFSSLDDLITAEAKKLNALKAHKKGLMQELFPREGETVPRLRFPEFMDAGEWQIAQLIEIASLLSEKIGDKKCILLSITSGVGLVSQIQKFGREIAGSQYKNYNVIKPFDFAYNKSATKDFPEGFIAMYRGEGCGAVPNSIFTCFRVLPGDSYPLFLYYLFLMNIHGKWLRRLISVGARAHGSLNVNNDDLLATPVPIPPKSVRLAEQHKIADCLSSLDELITAQARKVEALKTHKKGLMQQLFPVADTMAG